MLLQAAIEFLLNAAEILFSEFSESDKSLKHEFSFIKKISMSTILIDKMCSLVTTALADVDGFKWCIQFTVSRASSPEHKKLSEL